MIRHISSVIAELRQQLKERVPTDGTAKQKQNNSKLKANQNYDKNGASSTIRSRVDRAR